MFIEVWVIAVFAIITVLMVYSLIHTRGLVKDIAFAGKGEIARLVAISDSYLEAMRRDSFENLESIIAEAYCTGEARKNAELILLDFTIEKINRLSLIGRQFYK